MPTLEKGFGFGAVLAPTPVIAWREPEPTSDLSWVPRVPHSLYVGVGLALAGVTISTLAAPAFSSGAQLSGSTKLGSSTAEQVDVQNAGATSVKNAATATTTSTVLATTTTTQAPAPTTTTAAPAPTTTTTTARPRTTPTTSKKPAAVKQQAAAITTGSSCSLSRAAAEACWGGLIRQYGWNYQTAFNVMWCESSGNPNARNPHSSATGLFQILNGPTDPQANVALAYSMYKARGWEPWVCKG